MDDAQNKLQGFWKIQSSEQQPDLRVAQKSLYSLRSTTDCGAQLGLETSALEKCFWIVFGENVTEKPNKRQYILFIYLSPLV